MPKAKSPSLSPATQHVLAVPGSACDNCGSRLAAIAYQHRQVPRKTLCRGCLCFLVGGDEPAEEAQPDVNDADIAPPFLPAPRPAPAPPPPDSLIPPTPPASQHTAIVAMTGGAALNLYLEPGGTWYAAGWLLQFGNWIEPDVDVKDYYPTVFEVEAACRDAAKLPLHCFDHYPDDEKGLMLFRLCCPLDAHPERWRLTRIEELAGVAHARHLRVAGVHCWGDLALYLQRHGQEMPVKGIGARAWRLLLDAVRDAWLKGTAQGERGEVPDWLPAEALTQTEREEASKRRKGK